MSSMYVYFVVMIFLLFNSNGSMMGYLVSLEGLMLVVLFMMVMKVGVGIVNYNCVSVFMYMMVSEGVLGLSVLIAFVRGVGEDNFFYHDLY